MTGLTFGSVAGVHAGWNPEIPDCPPLTEFYVIEEKTRNDNKFAAKGDSGAAVVTTEGKVVRFVFAIIDVIIDSQSKIPDIATIANCRRRDRTVDIDQL